MIVEIVLIILIICILFILISKNDQDKFIYQPYPKSCEFKPECLGNIAKVVPLSNNRPGVCTLHGLACPSFMNYENNINPYFGRLRYLLRNN